VSIGDLLNIIIILFLIQAFTPILQSLRLNMARRRAIRAIERRRGSRLITMIHRQESVSLLGIPVARYINIEDSEAILRAIRLTDPDVPIDLVLHTPGGLVLAAEQIASALNRHPGRVTVFVPHYAMSGGTLVALAADEIVMDPNAVLGPTDPQLGDPQHGYYPASSVLAALAQPNPNRDDTTLMLGDMARKAIKQVHDAVYSLVKDKMPPEQAENLARQMSEGQWTHDYPINADEAARLGLRISTDMPREFYDLMDLYPQPSQRRPSVEFIPVPYRPVAPGRGREHLGDDW